MKIEAKRVRDTNANTKHGVILWAVELMQRAGVQVTQTKRGDTYSLTLTVPPDPKDPHGQRYADIVASNAHQTR